MTDKAWREVGTGHLEDNQWAWVLTPKSFSAFGKLVDDGIFCCQWSADLSRFVDGHIIISNVTHYIPLEKPTRPHDADEYRKSELHNQIEKYFEARGLTMPDTVESLAFLTTEVGEVWEEWIQNLSGKDFVRNDPSKEGKKENWKQAFAEELGDVIIMAMVTGMTVGIDPLLALEDKMLRKTSTADTADTADKGE